MMQAPPLSQPVETVPMAAPDGTVIDVPAARAHEAFVTGQASLIKGTTIPVNVDGVIRPLSAEEAADVFETPGAGSSAAPSQLADQLADERASTVGARAAAFGIGAGNALTLGFGKAAAAGAGQVFGGDEGQAATEKYIREREERNPYAMGAGEVTGLVAPALLSGGASLAARGSGLARGLATAGEVSGAPLRALGLAGDIGASLGERAAVAAGASEGGLISRLAGHAARGAVEMPAFEIGNAVSRAAIHDEPLTAEQLYAAGLHGVLTGAIGGAALGGIGSLATGTGKLAGKLAERSGALAEELGLPAIPRSGSEAREVIEAFRDRKSLSALGGNVKQLEKFGPEGGSFWKDAAAMVRERLPGVKDFATMTKREFAERAPALVDEIGNERNELFRAVEQTGAKPNLAAVAEKIRPIEAELAADIAGRKHVGNIANNREFLEGLAAKGAGFKEVQQQISSLKREIRTAARQGEGTLADQKQKIVDLLDAEIDRAGVSAIDSQGGVGAEWAARWRKNTRDYALAKRIEEAAEKGAIHEARNRSGGMSEHLGSILGGVVGGVPGAIGTAIASNLARRYGDQVLATVAAKAAKSDAVRAIGDQVSHAITSSASAFAGGRSIRTAVETVQRGAPHAAVWANEANQIYQRGKERSAKEGERDYHAKRDALARVTPEAVAERTAGLSDLPGVQAQLQAQALKAAEFLKSKLPPEAPNLHPMQAGIAKPRDPAPSEITKFERYARAVDDPLSVVEDMARGRITRESVEALRAVYPRLYGEAVGAVTAAVAQRKEPLSYDREVQIGILLGIETTPMLSPALVRNAQATYAPVPAASPSGSPNAGAPKSDRINSKGFDIAGEALTPGQKLGTK
jgi:hypothetical protein